MFQEAPTSSPVTELWLPLKEVANVSLYRNNAFRVLGLSITATTSDIRNQQQLRRQRDLGIKDAAQCVTCLPLESSPDANLIRQAVQRLTDPAQRLVNELFWFWPANLEKASSDTALQLLAERKIAQTVRIWESQLAHPVTRHVARHNLAIFHHTLALDYEQTDNPSPTKQPDDHWNEAFPHWSALIADDNFWDWIAARIRQTNDPRLTLDTLQQLRQGLPQALITPNVTLAVKAMKQNDLPRVKRHHSYLVGSNLGAACAPILLENELHPVRDSLKTKCEQAISQLENAPAEGDTIAAELLTIHAGFWALLPEDNYLFISASNALAEALRACAVAFGNATNDWERCRELSALVHALSRDPDVRSRAAADIKQLDENIREAKESDEIEALRKTIPDDYVYDVTVAGTQITIPQVCPCCLGEATGNQKVSYSWQEYRGATQHQRSISYEFPLCEDCVAHEEEYAWKRWLPTGLAVAASAATALLLIAPFFHGEPATFIAAGLVLTVVCFLIIHRVLSIRPLPPDHACRNKAVSISTVSGLSCVSAADETRDWKNLSRDGKTLLQRTPRNDAACTFVFQNPLYARAFAASNNSRSSERYQSKPSRTSRILSGMDLAIGLVVAVLLSGIAHYWISSSMEEEWRRQDFISTVAAPVTPSTPIAPAAQSVPYTPPAPVFSGPSLSVRIERLRATIRLEEQSISKLDADSDATSTKLSTLAAEIEQFEKKDAAGLYVNRTLYQNVIDEHNAIVRTHNALLVDRRATYAEYSRAIDSVNDMVRRYNAGQR